MPHKFVPVSDLEDVVACLFDAANRVANAVKWMKDANMPEAHLDIDAVRNIYLRKTSAWAIKMSRKIEVDVIDFKAGRELQSVSDQKRNAKALKKRKQKEKGK